MKKIAITGGIGSGKSHICRILERRGIPVFYCDDEAKRIIRSDEDVKSRLKALVGNALYDADGKLCKPVLAAFLCKGKEYASGVDAIVHPQVAKAFTTWCEAQEASIVAMECALLFESGFNRLVDKVIHIAAPEEVRIERVMQRDGVSREKALAWMALQMPEEEKERRATHIICNDEAQNVETQMTELGLQ